MFPSIFVQLLIVQQTLLAFGVAKECADNQYYSEEHGSCNECGTCPEEEELVANCTNVRNTACRCKADSYRIYPTWSIWGVTCRPCTRCGDRGYVRNCSASDDAKCGDCPKYFYLHNTTHCAPCSPCPDDDPFAIRMRDCELAGLPPNMQCTQQEGSHYHGTVTFPPIATELFYVSSSTDTLSNARGERTPNDTSLAGEIAAGLTVLMLGITVVTALCFVRSCVKAVNKDNSCKMRSLMLRGSRRRNRNRADAYEDVPIEEVEFSDFLSEEEH